jgi:light-regulated signal transduction histidine kinase (bacteriophytochrome)
MKQSSMASSENSEHPAGNQSLEHSFEMPDTIQPHGVLLSIDREDFVILQVSENSKIHLGVDAHQLLSQPLASFTNIASLRDVLHTLAPEQNRVAPVHLTLRTPEGKRPFNGFVHLTDALIILELEPIAPSAQDHFFSIHTWVSETLYQLQQTTTLTDLCHLFVGKIRALTGYDRVHVYRFDEQGAGEVIAEAKHDSLPSYLGLHFPEQDIPAPIREFYSQGKLRMIPNLTAEHVSLVPSINPKTQEPLDLSLSILRSVHPCCVEYYQNIGTSAALVLSLINDHTLWGLLSCHHHTEKEVPYNVRTACELLTQMTALELANKIRQEDFEYHARIHAAQSELIGAIAQADNFVEALIQPQERLLTLVNASGVAVCLGEHLTLVGDTPTSEQVHDLIHWADCHITDNIFHTHQLSKACPEAEPFKDKASGLLLLRLSRVQHHLILWFRPEVLQDVNWAGNPAPTFSTHEDGHQALCPRASFEQWQETVSASSLPWHPTEINGVKDLRDAVIGIVLKRSEELAQLNRELQHSNEELASFAYAAAHDLKEPLRGIYNYVDILLEDYVQNLDTDGQRYLTEIQIFAHRMETLISALLRIAQLRQVTLHYRLADLNELLEQVAAVIRASWPDLTFDLRIPHPLPHIYCDPVLLHEVFRNLVSNALKYNDQTQKWIEVGYHNQGRDTDAAERVFYVKDNGIGISPEHYSKVFTLFKRLHPQDHYGGGSGVGLAVVNQIINRHGGKIWVESIPGEGSTFFFSISIPATDLTDTAQPL